MSEMTSNIVFPRDLLRARPCHIPMRRGERIDGTLRAIPPAGTNMIMILETTSGGRSTGTDPLTWGMNDAL